MKYLIGGLATWLLMVGPVQLTVKAGLAETKEQQREFTSRTADWLLGFTCAACAWYVLMTP